MDNTYRMDVRYVPEANVRVLDRLQLLIDASIEAGFEVSSSTVFDDGMRISLLVSGAISGHPELALLAAAASTGTIGRFSCRQVEKAASDERSDTSQVETPQVLRA